MRSSCRLTPTTCATCGGTYGPTSSTRTSSAPGPRRAAHSDFTTEPESLDSAEKLHPHGEAFSRPLARMALLLLDLARGAALPSGQQRGAEGKDAAGPAHLSRGPDARKP